MSVQEDTTNLNKSVEIQEQMLSELKSGNIYQQITAMNKTVSEKLEIIAENTAAAGGMNFLGLQQGGNASPSSMSAGRYMREASRPNKV